MDAMSLEKHAFRFISDYGHIESIKEQCRRYTTKEEEQGCKKTVMAVYKITLLIDAVLICEEHVELGNLVLHCPSSAWQVFHSVVFKIIQEMKWLPHVSSSTQLLLVLRLAALPDLPGYNIEHFADLPKITDNQRFIAYTGVVCGMSAKEKYTESACFHCSNSSCLTRTTGDKYIRMHITGHTEAMTVRGAGLTCSQCNSPLSEDIAFRILSEKLLIDMIPVQSLRGNSSSKPIRYQSLTAVLRGELCDTARIGDEFTVIGIPVHEIETVNGKTTIKTTIEANNLYPCNRPTLAKCLLTNSVMDIYKAQLFPPGIYHRLKLALLLSIVVARTDKRKVNLLVVGSEYHHGNMLFDYGASFLSRKIRHSSGMDLIGTARKDWMDAGSIPLSSSGVCIIENVGSWKSDHKEALSKVLEDQTVTIKSAKPMEAGVSRPLSTTLWTICDTQFHTRGKPLEGNTKIASIPKHLIDHLGILVTLDPPTMDNEELVSNVITDHILQAARNNPSITPLTRNDYEQLFCQCSSIDVALSAPADSLLKGYYLASRRARGSDFQSTMNTPKSAMDILIVVTLAHARLSLRNEATEDDAILAILLYEEGLLIRTGDSPLCLQLAPHVRNEDISEHIGIKFDSQMKEFTLSVQRFIQNYAGSIDESVSSPFLPEE